MQHLSWLPHGLAIRDYRNGKTDAKIMVTTADGDITPFPAEIYFRNYEDFSIGDEMGLLQCRGRVLDIGAGAGSVSLVLQDQGLEVTALDIAPHAVEVMQELGVQDARSGDFYDFSGERYDTLLMLMNGVGFVGHVKHLKAFFDHAATLLKPGGQLILDSSDLAQTELKDDELNGPESEYYGEVWYQMEYEGTQGAPYYWLYIDPDTLLAEAKKAGWEGQVILEADEGYYLAALSPVSA